MTNNGMSRRNFVKLSGIVAAGLGLAGCGGSNQSSGSSGGSSVGSGAGAIKIGGIGPVTGATAIYGNATKFGAQVAVDLINKEAGSTVFELNWQDDEGDAEKAVNAYNTLMDWGMQVLVGTTTTTPCVAVASKTSTDRVFELTPSASSTDVTAGKDNVFQMCFTDPNQGEKSAEYISKKNLGKKVAVIYNNSDAYSTGIYNGFSKVASGLGLEIVSTQTFTDDSAQDFSVQLNDAKSKGADLVFLPIYYTPASLILQQAKNMGFAPKFVGCDGMDGILTVQGFDTSLAEGLVLLTPFVASASDENTVNFVKAYKELTGTGEDPNQFAADAYDCVYAIYAAVKAQNISASTPTADMCNTLLKTFGSGTFTYSSLTGKDMTWSSNGEVSKDPKGVVIKNGKYESLDAEA